MDSSVKLEQTDILFEDEFLLAVNKKAGWLVQGDRTGAKPLSELVREYLGRSVPSAPAPYAGVIHRLDRCVSGVLLLAKTQAVCGLVNGQFERQTISKSYWAIVNQCPPAPAGRLIHYLKKNSSKNKSFAYTEAVPGTRQAVLCYEQLACWEGCAFLVVHPLTGRHHQIRVQLAGISCPVKGDLKYGGGRIQPGDAIYLHARSLTVRHPVTGQSLRLVAAPPADPLWQRAMDAATGLANGF